MSPTLIKPRLTPINALIYNIRKKELYNVTRSYNRSQKFGLTLAKRFASLHIIQDQ